MTDQDIGPPRSLEPAVVAKTRRPLILYASETGTAEGYARQAARRLAGLAPQVLSMDEVDLDQLSRESLVLVVASTCRDGDAPQAGQAFLDWLRARRPGSWRAGVLGARHRQPDLSEVLRGGGRL